MIGVISVLPKMCSNSCMKGLLLAVTNSTEIHSAGKRVVAWLLQIWSLEQYRAQRAQVEQFLALFQPRRNPGNKLQD